VAGNPDTPPTADDTDDPTLLVWTAIADQAERFHRVLIPLAVLSDRTGLDLPTLDLALDQLSDLGLLTCWDDGHGPTATLSPLAASRLGLKLRVDHTGQLGLAWVALTAKDRRTRLRPRKVRPASDFAANLDRIASDALRPDQIAEAREQAHLRAPRPGRRLSDAQSTDLPRPIVILTGSATLWAEHAPGTCPACLGARLPSSTYCLRCDRWGLDWLLHRLRESDRLAAEAKLRARSLRTFAGRHAHTAAAVA